MNVFWLSSVGDNNFTTLIRSQTFCVNQLKKRCFFEWGCYYCPPFISCKITGKDILQDITIELNVTIQEQFVAPLTKHNVECCTFFGLWSNSEPIDTRMTSSHLYRHDMNTFWGKTILRVVYWAVALQVQLRAFLQRKTVHMSSSSEDLHIQVSWPAVEHLKSEIRLLLCPVQSKTALIQRSVLSVSILFTGVQ